MPPSKIYERFREAGFDENTLRLIKNIHSKTKCRVRTNRFNGPYFDTTAGVPQGCPLSPVTFIIFCDIIIQELNATGLAFKLSDRETAVQLFADDLVIIADDEDKMHTLMKRCKTILDAYDLKANVSKCAVLHMKSDMNPVVRKPFKWGYESIPLRDQYTYLGIIIQTNLPWVLQAKKVLRNANFAFFKIKNFLCDMTVPTKLRLQAFNSMIKPIFDYASEIWHPPPLHVKKLGNLYMEFLKRTIGCNWDTSNVVLMRLSRCKTPYFYKTYFRMLFKYRLCDPAIDGLFCDLWDDLRESTSPFAKWWRWDDSLEHIVSRLPKRNEIKDVITAFENRGVSVNADKIRFRYDATVWDLIVNNHALDEYTSKEWNLPAVLDPHDFAFLCEILGNSNAFIKNTRRCFKCGASCSFQHNFVDCKYILFDEVVEDDFVLVSKKNSKSSGLAF